MNLRGWLRRKPEPVSLMCDTRVVRVADGPRKWAETEASVVALDPATVQALDGTGAVLRVCELREDGEVETSKEDAAKSIAKEEDRDVKLMRIVLEATDRGAQRHSEAYRLSFDHLVQLVQILATRLGGLEVAWQNAMEASINAKADAAAAGPDADTTLAMGLLTQAMTNGKALNGKNKGKADG